MNQKSIFYIISLSIILFLGIVFVWLPKYQEINVLKMEIKNKEMKLQTKKQYFQKLEKFSEQLKEHSLELDKINSGIPSSPDIPDIFNFLTKIASQNGLVLVQIDAEKALSLSEYSSIKKTQLKLSLFGSYASFKNFLSNLQTSSRLFFVEGISFNSPKEEEIFPFNLEIKVHSY